MTKRFVALVPVLVAAMAVATGCGTTSDSSSSSSSSSGGKSKTIKAAWIYVGSADDAGWTPPTTPAGKYAASQLGSKLQTTFKENVPEGPADHPGHRRPRARRQQDHLRHVVRLPGRDGQGAPRSTPTSSSSRPRAPSSPRTCPSTTAPVRTRSTSRAWPPARPASPAPRLRRAVRDPRGDPRHQRVHARRADHAPRRDGQGRVDQHLVRPRQGEQGGPGSLIPRAPTCSARARTALDRRGGEGQGPEVDRLRLRSAALRPEELADRRGLQLGPVLHQADPGGDGRHLEVRRPTTARSRTASPTSRRSAARSRRPRRARSTPRRRRSWTARSTSSRVRCTTSRAR